MKYILLLFLTGQPMRQIGPFDNIFACEQAAEQARLASSRAVSTRAGAVCINLKAKPHHWNGKDVPK